MHHALEIQEILLNIFDNCRSVHTTKYPSELAFLARTCRTFKEPALDVLWRVLHDSSPLGYCLPEATRRLSRGYIVSYTFTRPLTQIEWDTLQSYTRRIQSIQEFNGRLDWKSVKRFLKPPTSEPLFPNLRVLRCTFTEETLPLLCLPLPSLVDLNTILYDPQLSRVFLRSLSEFSPNIRSLSLSPFQHEAELSKFLSNCICHWPDLQTVSCRQVTLDADALVHLSRMHALAELDFMVSASLPASGEHLIFSNLLTLRLKSESLNPVSQLLSQVRLPAITTLEVYIDNCPFVQSLSSFVSVTTSSAAHTIERLALSQTSLSSDVRLPLIFEAWRPCVAFNDIRYVNLDIQYDIDMTDDQLLALASAWPQLEHLLLNQEWGWNSLAGITPGGLVRLLQMCSLLHRIALALNTRDYIEVIPSQVPTTLGLRLTPKLSVNLVDSMIEEESMPAVTTFLCGIAAGCGVEGEFSFNAWDGAQMTGHGWEEYRPRWNKIRRQVLKRYYPAHH